MKSSVNFNSVATMLCGKELTREQKLDVEALREEYEEARSRKTEIKEDK